MNNQLFDSFLNWAQALLRDGDVLCDTAESTISGLQVESSIAPIDAENRGPYYLIGKLAPENSLAATLARHLIDDYGANERPALQFADRLVDVLNAAQQFESWTFKQPLSDSALSALFDLYHWSLDSIYQRNNRQINPDAWAEDDLAMADRLTIAILYLLAWQPVGISTRFLFNVAEEYFYRACELAGDIVQDSDAFPMLWLPMQTLRQRINFVNTHLFGYVEGAGDPAFFSDAATGDTEGIDLNRLMVGVDEQHDEEGGSA